MLIGLSMLTVYVIGLPGHATTAAITTAVVLVASSLSPQLAWQQPILRLADTVVGVAVGVAAAWLGLRVTGRQAGGPVTAGGPPGRLLSVNVGLPQDVAWHGQTVRTGIWKRPVDGPSQVRRLNIDGDGQGDLAGHGGEHRAVFVYQIESYRYWQDELGRDDFEYGQFGENFTVSGLADDQVCIGDRYQIGEALFEVTQPRVTCYRVGIRMDEPRMPSLLVSHHRPGFYFRVLARGRGPGRGRDRPGGRGAGGDDRRRGRRPALPARALPRPGAERAAHPGAARGLEGLVPGHGGPGRGARRSRGQRRADPVSPPPAWPGFRPLAVTAVNRESDSVVSVSLADPGRGTALPPPSPGSS